jgi:GMP synthase (glutamine-hydrolysing)
MANLPRPVLVVDFGAQYAQLIARRVREAHLYSEVVPHTWSAEQILAKQPLAIILSGGPSSVYVDDAPAFDEELLQADVPVFGICYGFQVMAAGLGGRVDKTGLREYGRTALEATESVLFAGQPEQQSVWMSHGDAVVEAPADCDVVATTAATPVAAFVHRNRPLAGVQFHPEVAHTDHGQAILQRFLYDIAGLTPNWSTEGVIDAQIAGVSAQIGDGRAICGLSGGVDSAVAAALVQRAIGERLTCVFVDHGLLRQGEVEQVERDFVAATGARLAFVQTNAGVLAVRWTP